MKTVLWIAKRELNERVRDGRLILSAAALLVVLSASFAVGWHRYHSRSTQAASIQNAERQRWLAQRARSPHTAAHQGVYVFRQEGLLSTLDDGVDSFFGIATHAEDEQHFFVWKPAEDEIAAHRFGQVSIAAMLQFIVPLILIVLVYPVFVSDRENGTARLTMSLGVTKRDFLWGKLLGALLPLTILLPFVLIVVLLLALLAGVHATEQVAPSLVIGAFAYGVYLLIYVALAVAVSALAHSSRSAVLTLLLVWSVLAFVLPHLATEVVERIVPTPTAADVLNLQQKAGLGGPSRDDRIREIQQELLTTYKVGDVHQLPLSPVGVFMVRSAAAGEPASVQAFDTMYSTYARQEKLLGRLGTLDPAIGIQDLSMALAQTDSVAMVDAAHSAESYRFNLVQTMNRDVALHRDPSLPINTLAEDYHRGIEVWSQVPQYVYTPRPLREVMRQHMAGAASLAAWAVAACLFAAWAVARMKVDA